MLLAEADKELEFYLAWNASFPNYQERSS
jgi:hypothetical protein